MVRQKISYKSVRTFALVLLAATFLLASVCVAFAADTEARTDKLNSIIEAVRVRQYGGNKVVLEFRGTKMTQPRPVEVDGTALALVGTQLNILPLMLFAQVSDGGTDLSVAAALSLILMALCVIVLALQIAVLLAGGPRDE